MHLRALVLLAAALAATGCEATGMGRIQSALDSTQKATFGFVFRSDGTAFSFSGSYHDKAAGVDLKGAGVLKRTPAPSGTRSTGGCLSGPADYVSQNPDQPGNGRLELTVCDLDDTFPFEDLIVIDVLDGPFELYFNSGFASGNITVTCSDDCEPAPPPSQ
jgi:hypothetical protein